MVFFFLSGRADDLPCVTEQWLTIFDSDYKLPQVKLYFKKILTSYFIIFFPQSKNQIGFNPIRFNPIRLNPIGLNPMGLNPMGLNPMGLNPMGL